METFEFEPDLECLDDRSVFANRICKLIFQKHNGNLDKAIVEAEPIFNDLERFVRNIYELVETEIPLYAYFQLLKYGANNWRFDQNEYKQKIAKTQDACIVYYGS